MPHSPKHVRYAARFGNTTGALWRSTTWSKRRRWRCRGLYDDAALWEQTARELPDWAGCHIALLLGVSPDTTVPPLARAINAFLLRAGDQRAVVDRTIARIAASYRDYPISRVVPAPPVPEHIMPETEAEARDRLALVRSELALVHEGICRSHLPLLARGS